MSENPLQAVLHTFEKLSASLQTQLSQFIGFAHHPLKKQPFFSSSSPTSVAITSKSTTIDSNLLQPTNNLPKKKTDTPVTKEELGRATWTFLHTLAAQYPDKPTRQQKKDVKELMAILSRMYPCKECADHFKEVLRANPVQVGSQAEFSQWLCHTHNVVNRSLGKVVFPCERVDARWGKLECELHACDLQGIASFTDEDIFK